MNMIANLVSTNNSGACHEVSLRHFFDDIHITLLRTAQVRTAFADCTFSMTYVCVVALHTCSWQKYTLRTSRCGGHQVFIGRHPDDMNIARSKSSIRLVDGQRHRACKTHFRNLHRGLHYVERMDFGPNNDVSDKGIHHHYHSKEQ